MKLCQQRALEEHGKRKDLLRLVLVLLSFHFSCLWSQFGWASRWGHPGGPLPYVDVRNKEPPFTMPPLPTSKIQTASCICKHRFLTLGHLGTHTAP